MITAGELQIGDKIITKDEQGRRHQKTVKEIRPCPTERANIHVNGADCYFRAAPMDAR